MIKRFFLIHLKSSFRFQDIQFFFLTFLAMEKERLRGCLYGGELARLGGLAHLGEMIFIPCSYGIFYLSLLCRWKKII